MRLKDIKPNTLYATKDGLLIKTGDKIEVADYAQVPANKRRPAKWVKAAEPTEDPWNPRRTSQYTRRGLLVTAYKPDRDGQPVEEESEQWVAQTRDIAGTWELYLELHGDELKQRHIRQDATNAAIEERKRIESILVTNGFKPAGIKPQVDIIWSVEVNGEIVETTWVAYRSDQRIVAWRLDAKVTLPWPELAPLVYGEGTS